MAPSLCKRVALDRFLHSPGGQLQNIGSVRPRLVIKSKPGLANDYQKRPLTHHRTMADTARIVLKNRGKATVFCIPLSLGRTYWMSRSACPVCVVPPMTLVVGPGSIEHREKF